MQLALNRAHPLCLPSRNLVFATFGTGPAGGGQVLDLSDRPSHGVIVDDAAVPSVGRSLQSTRPPGFPSDWQPLTFRSPTAVASVEFGNVSKVTSLTSGFTAAVWVRNYWTGSETAACFGTATEAFSGWLIVNRLGGGGWQFNRYCFSEAAPQNAVTAVTPPANQWNLLAVTFVSGSAPVLYTNGVASSLSSNDGTSAPIAGSKVFVGNYFDDYAPTANYPANADIGPAFVWGSVLSADDVALLYRDTFGTVTRPTPLALRVASSQSAQATRLLSRISLSLGVGL